MNIIKRRNIGPAKAGPTGPSTPPLAPALQPLDPLVCTGTHTQLQFVGVLVLKVRNRAVP